MNIGRQIDHIVYAVKDLESSCNHLEEILGVRPVFGGHHHTQGTQNALLNLGNACYLELLAIDAQTQIPPPRWMGIDLIESPRITRWAIKSQNLENDSTHLKSYDSALGKIQGGQRKMQDGNLLTWKLVLPTAEPLVDVLPFMVDWQDSTHHPTSKLADECQLLKLNIVHPRPNEIQPVFEGLGVELQIEKGVDAAIHIWVKGQRGTVELF